MAWIWHPFKETKINNIRVNLIKAITEGDGAGFNDKITCALNEGEWCADIEGRRDVHKWFPVKVVADNELQCAYVSWKIRMNGLTLPNDDFAFAVTDCWSPEKLMVHEKRWPWNFVGRVRKDINVIFKVNHIRWILKCYINGYYVNVSWWLGFLLNTVDINNLTLMYFPPICGVFFCQ